MRQLWTVERLHTIHEELRKQLLEEDEDAIIDVIMTCPIEQEIVVDVENLGQVCWFRETISYAMNEESMVGLIGQVQNLNHGIVWMP